MRLCGHISTRLLDREAHREVGFLPRAADDKDTAAVPATWADPGGQPPQVAGGGSMWGV